MNIVGQISLGKLSRGVVFCASTPRFDRAFDAFAFHHSRLTPCKTQGNGERESAMAKRELHSDRLGESRER